MFYGDCSSTTDVCGSFPSSCAGCIPANPQGVCTYLKKENQLCEGNAGKNNMCCLPGDTCEVDLGGHAICDRNECPAGDTPCYTDTTWTDDPITDCCTPPAECSDGDYGYCVYTETSCPAHSYLCPFVAGGETGICCGANEVCSNGGENNMPTCIHLNRAQCTSNDQCPNASRCRVVDEISGYAVSEKIGSICGNHGRCNYGLGSWVQMETCAFGCSGDRCASN
jgi:hypothetical protein